MSKTTAPLLSFSASGQIAKTQVYSSWKGRPYVRRYTVPANPRSDRQTDTRSVFGWLNNVWKYAPALMIDAYAAYAQGQVMTDRNGFIKQNLRPLNGSYAGDPPVFTPVTVVTAFVFSPGAKSGPSLDPSTIVPGDDMITITANVPVLPDGWSVDSVVAAAIRQQDAHEGTLYTIASGSQADPMDDIVLDGLASAQTYVVGTWAKFIKPDGTFAYGRSVNATALTT